VLKSAYSLTYHHSARVPSPHRRRLPPLIYSYVS
jgi:hypothetical protein